MRLRRNLLIIAVCMGITHTVLARDLKAILRDSVLANPAIMEARANEAVSREILAQSKAARYPTVSASANQPMLTSGDASEDFTPGVSASWTVYDFGKTSAQIEYDQVGTQYYAHITDEAAQEWAYELACYYLSALREKL